MKRIVRNNRIIILAFFTVFAIASSLTAKATGDNNELPVQLKYAGLVNNQPLYQLIVAGNGGVDEYTVVIRDEDKNTIYRENIKGESFIKSFVLNTDELGDDKLHFEIISKNTKKSVAYEVSRYTHVEEKIVVTEVK
jgi:hypothetical protein